MDRLARELRVLNESAARSLAEGLEETLTLHRLGVAGELGRTFKTTNRCWISNRDSVESADIAPSRNFVTRYNASSEKR